MAVQHLMAHRVRLRGLEHRAILLEHAGGWGVETHLVHEAPEVALPAFNAAAPPREAGHGHRIDWRAHENDPEVSAGSGHHRIRNVEPAIHGAGVAPFAGIEIHIAL